MYRFCIKPYSHLKYLVLNKKICYKSTYTLTDLFWQLQSVFGTEKMYLVFGLHKISFTISSVKKKSLKGSDVHRCNP